MENLIRYSVCDLGRVVKETYMESTVASEVARIVAQGRYPIIRTSRGDDQEAFDELWPILEAAAMQTV